MDRSRMKEESIVRVIEKVTKIVVSINTLRVFHDVFYRVVPVEGMGSGFILDERGYILTNNYTIEKAERIVTTLTDGRVFEGKLVVVHRSSDTAIIKIDADKLTIAELGDSDNLRATRGVRHG